MPYKNKEDQIANRKKYYRENKEYMLKKTKEWRKNNKERNLELQRKHQFKYRAKHRKLKVAPDYSDGLKSCQDCKVKKPLAEFSLVKRNRKYYLQETYYHLCNKCKRAKWLEYAQKGGYNDKRKEYFNKRRDEGISKKLALEYYYRNKEKIKARIIEKRGYIKKEKPKAKPKPLLESRWYLKKTKLLNNTILEPEDIPEELMETYKLYLQLKREVQNVKTSSI